MRLILAICVFALTATPALARDHHASLKPLGVMHIPPAVSTPAPSASTPIPAATTAVLVEIEHKADLARVKSDIFDRRIRETSERAMFSICTGCLAAQPKAAHVRVRLAGDDAGFHQAVRPASFKRTASADHRYAVVAW